MRDQSLKCWGANNQGQLGNGEAGNSTHSTMPVTVSEAANMSFREVAVGYYNACAVTTSGQVSVEDREGWDNWEGILVK